MKILVTGVTGYIGKRLLIQLLKTDHELICVVRDKARFNASLYNNGNVQVVVADFERPETLQTIPDDIDIAYYFLHSLDKSGKNFSETEKMSAVNFKEAMQVRNVKQVIYLTGIVNEKNLSPHLESRKIVEEALKSDQYALTAIRAGIIIGSGSASFEIMRDLVEKLPIMIAPRWVNTRCQAIGIRNVIEILMGVANFKYSFNKHFDIGGPDILSYKSMLEIFAEERQLKRKIITVPVMTPRLSSYWLYFITSISYPIAKNLVDSMKVDVIATENDLIKRLNIQLLTYRESLQLAFDKIAQNDVMSTWSDSFSDSFHHRNIWQFSEIPTEGCFTDHQKMKSENEAISLGKIFGIGGKAGWYSAKALWQLRGLVDKLYGGVGLRRGRRNASILQPGDTVDFGEYL